MIELTATIRTTAAGPVFELAGELDYHSASKARDMIGDLLVEHGQQLVIDLGGLTFCDSSGIGVLIALRNHALSSQSEIALAAVPKEVTRHLNLMGLRQVFPTYSTAQDAADAWTQSAG